MSTPRNKNGATRNPNTFSSSQSQSNSNSIRRAENINSSNGIIEDLEEQKIILNRIPVVKVDSIGTELNRQETNQPNFMHQRT